jgi:hypothetical protein
MRGIAFWLLGVPVGLIVLPYLFVLSSPARGGLDGPGMQDSCMQRESSSEESAYVVSKA